MNEPSASSPGPDQPTTLKLEPLLKILGSIQAWKVLRTLADGSALLNNEIADRSGVPRSSVNELLLRLRDTGIVIAPRVKLYEIAPQFLADKTERVLDFGVCLLRLGAANL
jgi:DNA-binding transcriptional ArsR family regulator